MADHPNILRRTVDAAHQRALEGAVLQALQTGAGVNEATWPPATPLPELLAWLDQTIAAMRTPHGISGFLLIAFCDDAQDAAIELTCTTRTLWPVLREGLTPTLARLAAEHTITLTILAFGTALDAALQ